MNRWVILIISLPGSNKAPRMRVWRALKAAGAAILRDGVYLLPASTATRESADDQARAVRDAGGSAHLLEYRAHDARQAAEFRALLDRSAEYAECIEKAGTLSRSLMALDQPEARRREAQLRRELETIEATDFFPGEARDAAREALAELAGAVNRRYSPNEPTARAPSRIGARSRKDFRGRTWATRRDLWVDRVASAWLIRRYIDPNATFLWLDDPLECPTDAVGFDFDGATFTHLGDLVTFEVLLHAFELREEAGLASIGALVRYLDTGGIPIAEAPGFVALLGSVKRQSRNDDAFVDAAGTLFDHLLAAYAMNASR